MNRIERIKEKLLVLKPSYLEIIDQSLLHAHHNGMNGKQETHISIKISIDGLKQESLIIQHRAINHLLQDEFKLGLHALKIVIV